MKFKKYNTIKVEERRAVNKVMKSGILSNFFANKNKNFLGGKYVLKFELLSQQIIAVITSIKLIINNDSKSLLYFLQLMIKVLWFVK